MELNYRITVSRLSTANEIQYAPGNGVVNSAILHVPAGCNGLVEVIVNHGTNKILPHPAQGTSTTVRGIALDDCTQSFSINERVRKHDPLEVLLINHDGAEDNTHTISIVLLLEEERTYTGP